MSTLSLLAQEASHLTAQPSQINQLETGAVLLTTVGAFLIIALLKQYLERIVIITDLGTIVRLSLKIAILSAIAVVVIWAILTH